MSEQTVARRYALALFQIAVEQDILGQVEQELAQIIQTVNESPELKRVVEHQLITSREKKKVFAELFSGRVSWLTMNFLNLVLDKRRERYLNHIYRQFVVLANEARNILEVEIRSAIKLSQQVLDALAKKLGQSTGKNIRLVERVEPHLKGGAVLKVGDRIIDGSIATRLERMKKHLESTKLASPAVF